MEDMLQLYFERKKEGGGDVEAIKMIPEERAAIVTFLDPEGNITLSDTTSIYILHPIPSFFK